MNVLLLFFCSGATALVYEVVWSKYLSLLFGSTVQAQTVVLAVFMGGLALGNRLFGPLADRSPSPLTLYGRIEVVIGLYSFFFGVFYNLADSVFIRLGAGLLERGGLLLALKGVIAVGLLLGPTVLMGGTLPLLAAWLQKNHADAGRRSARFYAINSIGAVAGSWAAGFWLVRALGLTSTLQMTALVNVLVGLAAIALARRAASSTEQKVETVSTTTTEPTAGNESFAFACGVVALTGGVSMGLEVLASRALTLVFGASLQAFAIVLMAFILGIGLASTVISSPRWKKLDRAKATFFLLVTTAAFLGLLVFNIVEMVEFYRTARSGLARSEMGYRYHQVLAAALSMLVLGLPAGMLGAVLPLWIRTSAGGDAAFGSRVGRLLTWNTLGAVLGVLVTGFVLMPKIGLRGSFATLALVLCGAAAAGALMRRQQIAAAGAGAVGALLLFATLTGGENWRYVLGSGIFRMWETAIVSNVLDLRREHIKIHFYEDATDATVSVEESDGTFGPAQFGLRINGKIDATSHGDLATQYLLAHLPMLARPESKDVFVLGFGSGVTAGAVLGYPAVEKLVVAENCAPVLRASKFFDPWNRGVLTNRLTRVVNEDARTVLKLDPQNYDVIISEPSNPWMIGVGSVFSREFYELAARRLKPGGIMTQWFHLYEMHDGIVLLVLRSFTSVFPYVEIWDPGTGDMILLGSKQPWKSGADVFRRALAHEQPRKDLEAIGLTSPEAVLARQLASQRTGFAIAGDGGVQSDEFPILEYDAPEAFFIGASSRALFAFDERTWQGALAPAHKQQALQSLPAGQLRRAFDQFATVNPELDTHLRARFQGNTAAESERPLPVIFDLGKTNSPALKLPDSASETRKKLSAATRLLDTDPARWADAVTEIEAILRTAPALSGGKRLDWSPAQFAAAGVKACLAQNDHARAKNLLALGLQLAPNAMELQYLSRILERETAPPAVLKTN
ncbi:MAG: fused MFS/spermidine synthase [Verrucomicrobia bacterium]|nr:fused MFS/spermidine synthase [Verrucomicrobiota bacterium]